METMTSSPARKSRRPSGPVLVRSESLEAKFGFRSSNSPSVSSSSSSNRFRFTSVDNRSPKKKTCMCSPTTHPGSFRCSIHKRFSDNSVVVGGGSGYYSAPYVSNRLYARRSAVANSLIRLGTVDGYLVKRAVAALIRPSSHQQRRRSGFQPRPTRLSVMSTASEDA